MNDYAVKNINDSLLNLAELLDSVKGSIIGDFFFQIVLFCFLVIHFILILL